jgi:hypothetical protein
VFHIHLTDTGRNIRQQQIEAHDEIEQRTRAPKGKIRAAVQAKENAPAREGDAPFETW